jgi:hypothetical protein
MRKIFQVSCQDEIKKASKKSEKVVDSSSRPINSSESVRNNQPSGQPPFGLGMLMKMQQKLNTQQ